MPPATFKFDDTFSFVRPVQDGRTQVAYPFLSNGDRASCTYSRTLLQRASNYVPAVLGFERDSVWEGGDPAAYLISETSPEPTGVGDLMRFTRTYARLPAQQTVYSSRLIDRPVMHDITAGGWYAVSFDNGITSHIFSSRNTVSSVTSLSAVTSSVATALPPFSITLTSTAATTSTFNANTAIATIQAQLNADLPSCGTFTVTNPAFNKLNIAWTNAGTMSVVYSSSSNVAVSVTASTALFTATGTSTYPATVFIKLGSAHGATAGEQAAVWNGARLAGFGPIVSVPDSTTLCMRASDITSADAFLTHAQITPGATARYVNGPVNCTVKEVTNFYLPGVTSGITTPADIALVVAAIDPISWLTAIQASTSYLVVEGSQLSRWLDGPIYQQTTISVQMSDALESVAVGA